MVLYACGSGNGRDRRLYEDERRQNFARPLPLTRARTRGRGEDARGRSESVVSLDRWRAVRSTRTGDGVLWLLKGIDAIAAERDHNLERVPLHRAASYLANFRASDLRDLLSGRDDPNLGRPWSNWDSHIIGLAEGKLRDGELVMLLERRSGAAAATSQHREATIVRTIDRALRGQPLTVDGARFRLVVASALGRLPGRDDYQVVRRAQADALLQKAVVAADQNSTLREALAEARRILAVDEAPARTRAGILLVRYAPLRVAPTGAQSAPVTPAQLKASIAKDWIEIAVETSDGSPFRGHARLEFPDGRVETTVLSDVAVRFEQLVPGSVRVTLLELDGKAWQA